MSIDYRDPEDLRDLLVRLNSEGGDAWRHDDEAADLMRFTLTKYGALARKHRQEPEDAAAAAFEVMRTRAARLADDPWAVITRAVQVTLIAEERANGLLCSTSQARRSQVSSHHDAQRFSDRETSLEQYHPAFRVAAEQDRIGNEALGSPELPTGAYEALDAAVRVFALLGWPTDTARTALEYVCAWLTEAGSRANAHEYLRRDHHARAFLDLDRASWSSLLRVVLGSPNPDLAHSKNGRGILLRILIDETTEELLADDDLVIAISTAAQRIAGSSRA